MEMEDRSRDQAGTEAIGNSEGTPPETGCVSTELEEQKKAYSELNDKFLRLAADFENFRRRTTRDRETSVALANEEFAADVLEVVDNLDRALKADDSHLREGVMQIQLLLGTVMQRHGISPIDSLQKRFNPAEHEAIAHVLSDQEPGVVIDEVSRGYRMKDKVIRFAKVAVSKSQNNQEN